MTDMTAEQDLIERRLIVWDDKWQVYVPTHKAMREHMEGSISTAMWEVIVGSCRRLTYRTHQQEATDGGMA